MVFKGNLMLKTIDLQGKTKKTRFMAKNACNHIKMNVGIIVAAPEGKPSVK